VAAARWFETGEPLPEEDYRFAGAVVGPRAERTLWLEPGCFVLASTRQHGFHPVAVGVRVHDQPSEQLVRLKLVTSAASMTRGADASVVPSKQ
jgi:hypothetical protein